MSRLRLIRFLTAVVLMGALVVSQAAFAAPRAKGAPVGPWPLLRFAVIGDTRMPDTAGEDQFVFQPESFRRTIKELNLLDYDLALDVGDLIMGYEDNPAVIERMWDEFDKTWPLFRMPAKMVPGNHDIWNAASMAIWKRRYGRTYYSFDFSGCHFIVLDSEEIPDTNFIRGRQFEWLKADLEANKAAPHIFVVLHKPLWDYEEGSSNWNKDVHPLLARYGVRAVFAGHWHIYRAYEPKDGTAYFITGGGGAEIEGSNPGAGEFYHHMSVSVRGNEVKYAVVKTGAVLPVNIVTKEKQATAETIERQLMLEVRGAGVSAPLTVSCRNSSQEPLSGSVQWKIPEGSAWRIEPAEAGFTVSGGQPVSVSFTATLAGGRIFPLPIYAVDLRWKEGDPYCHTGRPLLRGDWFVREWMVIGPFDLLMRGQDERPTPAGFEKQYPPEQEIDFSKKYQDKAGEVAWKKCVSERDGYLDLRDNITPSDQAIAYAVAYIESPEQMPAQIALGSNDGAKVWLNGELVYSLHKGRTAMPDEDVIDVHLRPGSNCLLVKVENLGRDWGLYLRLPDPSARLRFTTAPSG